MSVVFGSLGGVGLLVSLALRWTDLVVVFQFDKTRHYYAGYELYDRLGAPGGFLTASLAIAGLGAICASGNGNARLSLRCGVLALVTVAAGCLALMVVGPPASSVGRGYTAIEPKLELGAMLAVVSAALCMAGGVLARRAAVTGWASVRTRA